MLQKFFTTALMTIVIITGTAFVATADVPPPPVNQVLGLFDATVDFTQPDIDREFCQQCHVGSQVERHHALVTPTFGCFECHNLSNGSFDEFRECTACHQSSPHHTTVEAQERHCSACHGSFVADYDDGHYIPDYAATSVTPLPGGMDLDPDPNVERFAGGCKACHMEDAAQGIASNAGTHHGTGLNTCVWCHDFSQGSDLAIRRCEDCHDVATLHNIQADSNNDGTITPGTETGGFGHIGANADCYGCHVKTFLPFQSSTDASPTVPSVASLSTTVVAAGQSANLKITGDSFTNVSGGQVFEPTVEISQGDEVVILYPLPSFTAQEMVVPVPETLKPGNYALRVKKTGKNGEVVSNKANLTVAEMVQIKSAKIKKNTITFKGNNFGKIAGEVVLMDNTQLTVRSWKNKKVVAEIPEDIVGQTVQMVTSSGAMATADVVATEIKTRKKTRTKIEAMIREQTFAN